MKEIIKDYLKAKTMWALKWEEIWEDQGRKNATVVDRLIQGTKEDDLLFVAKLKIEGLRAYLAQGKTKNGLLDDFNSF